MNYLAPGGSGRLWLLANVLYGLLLNLTPLLVGAMICGRIAGAVLSHVYPELANRGLEAGAVIPPLGGATLLVLAAAVTVGVRRFADKDDRRVEIDRPSAEGVVSCLLTAAGAVALFVGLLPLAVQMIPPYVGEPVYDVVLGTWSVRELIVVCGAVFLALCIGIMALWLQSRRRVPVARGFLGAGAGAAVLLVPFVISVQSAAVRPARLSTEIIVWAAGAAVMALFALFVHNRRYSLHLFYRERLQEAFAFRRVSAGSGVDAEPIPYSETLRLSHVADENRKRGGFPELVICAAVAARGSEVPSKTRAASFTFEGSVSGNRRLGVQWKTPQIEQGNWLSGGAITLPSMMAISGAAVSPLMGRFTLPAFRFLMAMLNVRLGVWIRNPDKTEKAYSVPSEAGRLQRMWRHLWRGWREPGALYVLKEALGRAKVRGQFVYVSDGGHWENLGVVELVRRHCNHIVVIDASGHPGLGDIGRAIAIARAELGVELKLDPRATLAEDAAPETPIAVGEIEYPNGEGGVIYYARSVLWDGAPSDLQLFAKGNRLFPNHPTVNQFFSGEVFDAYRALGWAVGEELVGAMSLPPETFDEKVACGPPCEAESQGGQRVTL